VRRVSMILLLAAAGCSPKPTALPRGLEAAGPGAPEIDCSGSFSCFDPGAHALRVEGGITTVTYRNQRSPRECVDLVLGHPPPRWTLLGYYQCGDSPPMREAFYAIDGRWGARVVDHSLAASPFAELVFIAEPDLRADARRAYDRGCRSLAQ
jgi:hypothetical protein